MARPTSEDLGQVVRRAWVEYCIEIGDTNPAHLAPWEALSEQDKEADRRIGEAVREALIDAIDEDEDRVYVPGVDGQFHIGDGNGGTLCGVVMAVDGAGFSEICFRCDVIADDREA